MMETASRLRSESSTYSWWTSCELTSQMRPVRMRQEPRPTTTSDSGQRSMQLTSTELCQCGAKLSGVCGVWSTRRTGSRSVGTMTSCSAVAVMGMWAPCKWVLRAV